MNKGNFNKKILLMSSSANLDDKRALMLNIQNSAWIIIWHRMDLFSEKLEEYN